MSELTHRSRSHLYRWAAIIVIVGAIATLEPRLVLTKSGSVKYHLLFDAGGSAAKGDYVNVVIRHPIIDAERSVTLTKRVACVGGELLEFRDDAFFCEKEPIGAVLTHTSTGVPLEPFAWDGPVPAGKAFIAGDHERSFDSRYFGFVDLSGVRKLWPLF